MLVSKKQKKLRHSEYYNMTKTLDSLYTKSVQGKKFTKLMDIITSEDNIKLAYRNIKKNNGSYTAGVDKLSIKDLAKLTDDKFIKLIKNNFKTYKPKPVRRVEIPKPNGKTRPLGIPTIRDRIIQQCILQVLEPICEAKFHERSNGFRPNRSTEHAIAQCYKMIQRSKLHFVVDIDIKGFFDNVNHSKLKKQMWNLGIQDKKLLCIISEMLKAPIIESNGNIVYPKKGTPQGGILSPLLSNIVLNELDWWISNQWEDFETEHQYHVGANNNGSASNSTKLRALRTTTKLKEMYIIRYADDFKIFCKNRSDADKAFIATKMWLMDRLKLEVSEEKSKVINLKKQYSEFLGFKLKAHIKNNKYTVKSHMSDKAKQNAKLKLKSIIKQIQSPSNSNDEYKAVALYNSTVWGIHNYYQIATNISVDCNEIKREIDNCLINRLRERLSKYGELQDGYIKGKYGASKQIRFVTGNAISPIGFIRTKNPMFKKRSINKYTPQGRKEIHKNLGVNIKILTQLCTSAEIGRSIEFTDNRISLYAAQQGKCAITGNILDYDDIHCHHKLPVKLGGTDNYKNLVIVSQEAHKLIHATCPVIISKYIGKISPTTISLKKINKLRKIAKLKPIAL